MAKATLPTNFKDDILASSMGSKRRYNVINNSDGTISLEDATTYTQVGSTFGAAQINATNAAANAAADASKIIDDYDTLMANTASGYMAGALAVKELNSNLGELDTIEGTFTNYEIVTINFSKSSKIGYLVIVGCGDNCSFITKSTDHSSYPELDSTGYYGTCSYELLYSQSGGGSGVHIFKLSDINPENYFRFQCTSRVDPNIYRVFY